ncbi:PREDICTED: protein singed wings 2-like [Rhagoletis zephyria]|uniref:protein singed wings 2-like n=1 Tax=Rhagoletis zephyria TaxID=28612 RepID=UPI000811A416|nr:PREDICTED: protein singed wings 2-like [Rhagoletis zephyria]
MPERLPKNAKVIDLSNNQIRRLNSGRVKLSHWEHVNKIILQNNSLETLDGLDQIHSNWTIVYLDISGNLLTEIPYHILDREKVLSSRIDKILIGNNPYSCDCNTVKMQKWLQSNYRIIHDLANVRCGFVREELMRVNESSGQQLQQQQQQQQPQPQQLQQAIASRQGQLYNREILKINNLELCPSIASVEIFDIVNGILAFGIVFLLAKVTYDYFWQKRTGNLPQFWKVNY